MSGDIGKRLNALERLYQSGTCRTCFNHPVRILVIEEDSDEMISESMPEMGCLACGRPIASTIEVVGSDPLEV